MPIVLLVFGFAFSYQQEDRQQNLEEQRAQDLALQGYLDTMSTLVLKDLADTRVQAVMRSRTLTALERLNPSRKSEVMQFLVEADLASGLGEAQPVVWLTDADLHDVNLNDSFLDGAKLDGANLRDAYLRGAELSGASLTFAQLDGAVLHDASLSETNLHGTDLSGADLSTAEVRDQHLLHYDLLGAVFEGATMPNGQTYEVWLREHE